MVGRSDLTEIGAKSHLTIRSKFQPMDRLELEAAFNSWRACDFDLSDYFSRVVLCQRHRSSNREKKYPWAKPNDRKLSSTQVNCRKYWGDLTSASIRFASTNSNMNTTANAADRVPCRLGVGVSSFLRQDLYAMTIASTGPKTKKDRSSSPSVSHR